MTVRVVCPAGHPLQVTARALNQRVLCPKCGIHFVAEADSNEPTTAGSYLAEALEANAKPKPRRQDDDDDDDDDEDDEPRRGKKPAPKSKKDDDRRNAIQAGKPKRARADDDDEDEDDDDEDVDDDGLKVGDFRTIRRKGRKADQLAMVANGLLCIQIALFSQLFMVMFRGLLIILIIVSATFGFLQLVALPFVCATPILYLIGESLCCWAPPKSESRGLAITALVLHIVQVLFAFAVAYVLLTQVVPDEIMRTRLATLLVIASVICFLLGFVTFMSYIKKVCEFMQDARLGSNATLLGGFLILLSVLFGGLYYASLAYEEFEFAVGNWVRYVVQGLTSLWTLYMIYFQIHLIVYVHNVRKLVLTGVWEKEEII